MLHCIKGNKNDKKILEQFIEIDPNCKTWGNELIIKYIQEEYIFLFRWFLSL